jgi:hypothetical protein
MLPAILSLVNLLLLTQHMIQMLPLHYGSIAPPSVSLYGFHRSHIRPIRHRSASSYALPDPLVLPPIRENLSTYR